jgi:hypothetical protein
MYKTVRDGSKLTNDESLCPYTHSFFHFDRATRKLADQDLTEEDRRMLKLEANTWELLQRVYECVSPLFILSDTSSSPVDTRCF